MTSFRQSIGRQIREQRKLKKIPSNVVANYLGRSNSTYTSYERGLTCADLEDYIKICNYLGLDYSVVVSNAIKESKL